MPSSPLPANICATRYTRSSHGPAYQGYRRAPTRVGTPVRVEVALAFHDVGDGFLGHQCSAQHALFDHQFLWVTGLRGPIHGVRSLEQFGVFGLDPNELGTPAVIGVLRDTELTAHRAASLPSANSRPAAISLRTICSAVPVPCRHDLVEPYSPQHGRKTPAPPDQSGGACRG
jgi:hypothetical protein